MSEGNCLRRLRKASPIGLNATTTWRFSLQLFTKSVYKAKGLSSSFLLPAWAAAETALRITHRVKPNRPGKLPLSLRKGHYHKSQCFSHYVCFKYHISSLNNIWRHQLTLVLISYWNTLYFAIWRGRCKFQTLKYIPFIHLPKPKISQNKKKPLYFWKQKLLHKSLIILN